MKLNYPPPFRAETKIGYCTKQVVPGSVLKRERREHELLHFEKAPGAISEPFLPPRNLSEQAIGHAEGLFYSPVRRRSSRGGHKLHSNRAGDTRERAKNYPVLTPL